MFDTIRAMFTGKQAQKSAPAAQSPSPIRPAVDMHWHEGTSWPIPDWKQIALAEQSEWSEVACDAFWSAAAYQWLERMAQQWDDYEVRESREFFLLSALPRDEARVFLKFCESARQRILWFLDGLASGHGSGKHVVIVLDDHDEYYDYISHYYPEGGEYAMSSGVFIHAGYGHFVLWAGEIDAMEPVIAHELTHCLVSHLPLPTWLDEGVAVNSERRIFPQLAHPSAQKYFPHEMIAKHAAFWNEESIQEFWSGEAFHRPDDGSMLAYDLATKVIALAARDFDAFRRFALKADRADAGLAAEQELGYPICNLVEAVLGKGSWQPRPDLWLVVTRTE